MARYNNITKWRVKVNKYLILQAIYAKVGLKVGLGPVLGPFGDF